MHSFEVKSNERACRKIGRLGMHQVKYTKCYDAIYVKHACFFPYYTIFERVDISPIII